MCQVYYSVSLTAGCSAQCNKVYRKDMTTAKNGFKWFYIRHLLHIQMSRLYFIKINNQK